MVKKTKKPEKVHAVDCDLDEDCTCHWTEPKVEPVGELLVERFFGLCRRFGVLEWDGPLPGASRVSVKFSLAPMLANDPAAVAPSSPPVPASQPEVGVKREKKRGADGLTAEMQDELLGRVMDAEG